MATLSAFNNVSTDGYFTDANNDMSWAHAAADDAEFNAFVAGNSQGGGALVLGRKTYDMMASFWPTDMAKQMMPEVAEGMNRMKKFVISNSMRDASWQNSKVLSGDIVAAIRDLKATSADNMTILGSGSIIAQLAQAGLIDAFQMVVNPIVLGSGRTMFEGVTPKLALKLTQSRTFANGRVLLGYEASV